MRAWHWDVMVGTLCAFASASNGVAFVLNVVRIPERPLFFSVLSTFQIGMAFWMAWLVGRAILRVRDARLAARMNVRIVRDGVELPARLYHLGERGGLDTWVVVGPDLQPGDELLVAVLPPGSVIVGRV